MPRALLITSNDPGQPSADRGRFAFPAAKTGTQDNFAVGD